MKLFVVFVQLVALAIAMLQCGIAEAFVPVKPLSPPKVTQSTTIRSIVPMQKNDPDPDVESKDPWKKPSAVGQAAAAAALVAALAMPLPAEAAMSGGRVGGQHFQTPPTAIERVAPRAYQKGYSRGYSRGYFDSRRPKVTISPGIGFGFGGSYNPYFGPPLVPVVPFGGPFGPFGASPFYPSYGGYPFGRPGIGIRFVF